MNRMRSNLAIFFCVAVALAMLLPMTTVHSNSMDTKKLVYDDAGLLSEEAYIELEEMAKQFGARRETDFIVYTSNNTDNRDVMDMTQDFYDEHAFGYDKPHGNAVILTLDMRNREVYLAGFYKAKQYLDDSRLDKIRSRITSNLSSGNYDLAFQQYIKTSYKYMGIRPGVNPDNILFNGWFQLIVALGIAGLIVGVMAYRSGGRITVHKRTYEDTGTSGIIKRSDQYIRTTTTKHKIPKNNGGGAGRGGGGGGRTGGGHSHSGSRGSF